VNEGSPGRTGPTVRYQEVHGLNAANIAPYAAMTYPSLAPGSRLWSDITGELFGVVASIEGKGVGLAIAERRADAEAAVLRSLRVDPAYRRRGIGTRLVAYLERLLAKRGVAETVVRYQATEATVASFEPLLGRLGWSRPQTDFVLIQEQAANANNAPWHERYSLRPPYEVIAWQELTPADIAAIPTLGAPLTLLPQSGNEPIEPSVSVALRHAERLVGWAVAHRVDADTVRYSSVYVVPGHRARGQGLALMAHAFQRHKASGIARGIAAIHVGNEEFMRVYRRHLKQLVVTAGESRSSRHRMRPSATKP
jgi:GNAT superfamily N-acetyltransferase